MLLKHLGTVLPAHEYENRICGIAWAPNNLKLAVATADRFIYLFDENGVRRDRFSTKPIESKYGKKSYVIKGIAFSPDSTKIAVGQTDCIVYVYKIGEQWGDRKVICNKFKQNSIVTCIVWPTESTIIVGLLDGRVRAAHTRSQKSQTLYAADAATISLAVNVRGTAFLSGHADSSIVRYTLLQDGSNENYGRLITHSTPPYCLSWPRHYILAAGCDCKVTFYDERGKLTKIFDYSREQDDDKEISSSSCSPSGQSVAVGSWNRIRIFDWSPKKLIWEETNTRVFSNFYSVTAMSWRKDGSKLVIGGLAGAVEQFETILKRTVVRGRHEVAYVGPSQIVVRPLTSDARPVIVRSQTGSEIEDVRVLGREDNKIVARTAFSLLIGDIESGLISEIPWENRGGNERFFFEYPSVCLIFSSGELIIVEYGEDVALGSVRTEFVNPHVVSIRNNERQMPGAPDNKRLAYLLDSKTIRILDLISGSTITLLAHDSKLDWLELSETGHRILARDKRARLWLGDEQGNKILLLSGVSFASWVPGSDVAVAQSNNNLMVWYNVDAPDVISVIPIKGEAVDIVREGNKTWVAVEEQSSKASYILDEELIEFGTALHDNDFGKLVLFLEQMGDRPQAESMWENVARNAVAPKQLLHAAASYGRNTMGVKQLNIAARCYAALGDIAGSRFLKNIATLAENYAKQTGNEPLASSDCWAKLAILNGELKTAEAIYLEQNDLQEALDMYKKYWRWEDALALAESRGWSGLEELRDRQLSWLLDSGQAARAASILEKTDARRAVKLYLEARRPGKAAGLILSRNELLDDAPIVHEVIKALMSADSMELAGELLEKTDEPLDAIKCYAKAGIFSRALELARMVDPTAVVDLEREWGQHLANAGHYDAAINHFIEAGHTTAALDAAINAKQWKKALQIVQVIEDDDTKVQQQCEKLAEYFSTIGEENTAETLFIRARKPERAVDCHIREGNFMQAQEVAQRFLSPEEAKTTFLRHADTLRESGNLKDAEELYLANGEYDLAIDMYRKAALRSDVVRLVARYRSDELETTHAHLAKELQAAGKPADAEHHFLAINDWQSAVSAYKESGMWEDAVRVAKNAAGEDAAQEVVLTWAKTLAPELAARLLQRWNYVEVCLKRACEANMLEWALEVAKFTSPEQQQEVHHRRALIFKNSGELEKAEEEFLRANRPNEAVQMYIRNQNWQDAERIASSISEEALSSVFIGRAEEAVQAADYALAESLLLRAHKPELIIEQYKKAGMWSEALRVCREYLPAQEPHLRMELGQKAATMNGGHTMEEAEKWLEEGEIRAALDTLILHPQIDRPALIKAADILLHQADSETIVDVGPELGSKLLAAGEHALAAQVFLQADRLKEAIDALISVGEWSRAQRIVQELAPDIEPYLQEKYQQSLATAEYRETAALRSTLEGCIERGDWDQVFDLTQDDPRAFEKYFVKGICDLISSKEHTKALELCAKYFPLMPAYNLDLYFKLAESIFNSEKTFDDYYHISTLRSILLNLYKSTEKTDSRSKLKRFVEAAHFASVRLVCNARSELNNIKMKSSIALLRYTDFILADRAYYEAGISAREQSKLSEAFVFLNHFLDLEECIEEAESGVLDVEDLAQTDFPREVPLNEFLGVNSEKREDVREWILAISVDQRVDQTLPLDHRGVYVGSLSCPTSSDVLPACALTGYPVKGSVVKFDNSNHVANREDWATFANTARQTPQDSEFNDVLSFVHEWCGNIDNYVF